MSSGFVGFDGDHGIQGVFGSQGMQGAVGVQGLEGLQGVEGAQGINGLQGIQGFLGVQGVTGTVGLQGPQGHTGDIPSYQLNSVVDLTGLTGVEWTGLTGNNFLLTVNNMVRSDTTDQVGWQIGGDTGYYETGYTGLHQQTGTFGGGGTRTALSTSFLQSIVTNGQSTTTTVLLRSYQELEYYAQMTGSCIVPSPFLTIVMAGNGAIATTNPITKIRLINTNPSALGYTGGFANVSMFDY